MRNACSSGYYFNDCQGKYQEGTSAQLRTNEIIAVTIGVAAATAVVGLFFTQWSPPAATAGSRGIRASGPILAPVVGIGSAGVEGSF